MGCRELHQSWDRYRANLLERQDLDNAGGPFTARVHGMTQKSRLRCEWGLEKKERKNLNSDCCAWTLRASDTTVLCVSQSTEEKELEEERRGGEEEEEGPWVPGHRRCSSTVVLLPELSCPALLQPIMPSHSDPQICLKSSQPHHI